MTFGGKRLFRGSAQIGRPQWLKDMPTGQQLPQQALPQPEPQATPEQPKMGLGSRLFGRGWEDKAFAVGGIMRGDPTGAYMIQQDKRAEQQALAQQAADLRKRSLDWADTKREIDYRAQNEGPKTYEDNAGNRWAYDPKTGQTIGDKPLWVDPTPKEFVHEGMRFSIRNPYAQGDGGSDLPTVSDKASYDAVPVGGQYRDAQGNIRTKSGGPSQPATGGF